MSQRTFTGNAWERREKTTTPRKNSGGDEPSIHWEEPESFLHPLAPRIVSGDGGGLPAYHFLEVSRIYFCQSWYGLSDEASEDALYDSEELRFVRSQRAPVIL